MEILFGFRDTGRGQQCSYESIENSVGSYAMSDTPIQVEITEKAEHYSLNFPSTSTSNKEVNDVLQLIFRHNEASPVYIDNVRIHKDTLPEKLAPLKNIVPIGTLPGSSTPLSHMCALVAIVLFH